MFKRGKKIAPKKGKIKNVVPKQYDGVQYKSSLEAYCAQKLTEAGLPVNYEKKSFPIMNKFTCTSSSIEFKLKKDKETGKRINTFEPTTNAIREMKYTPDFTDLEEGWIIEVKGLRDAAYDMRFKLFRHYLYRNNICYRLYVPNTKEQIDEMIAHILDTNS